MASNKLFLIIATILGALSVGIGAFGAHALKATLTANNRLDVFETAVKYQFYHTLALFFTGMLLLKYQSRYFEYAGWSFIAGIAVFSGSLYILSMTNVGKWGAVTPLGGLAFISGWILLTIGISKLSL